MESWHITPSLFCGLNIFFIDWSIGSVQYFRSYLQVYTYITTGVLYSIGKKSQMELSSADLKSTSDLNLLAMCLILQSLHNITNAPTKPNHFLIFVTCDFARPAGYRNCKSSVMDFTLFMQIKEKKRMLQEPNDNPIHNILSHGKFENIFTVLKRTL